MIASHRIRTCVSSSTLLVIQLYTKCSSLLSLASLFFFSFVCITRLSSLFISFCYTSSLSLFPFSVMAPWNRNPRISRLWWLPCWPSILCKQAPWTPYSVKGGGVIIHRGHSITVNCPVMHYWFFLSSPYISRSVFSGLSRVYPRFSLAGNGILFLLLPDLPLSLFIIILTFLFSCDTLCLFSFF